MIPYLSWHKKLLAWMLYKFVEIKTSYTIDEIWKCKMLINRDSYTAGLLSDYARIRLQKLQKKADATDIIEEA